MAKFPNSKKDWFFIIYKALLVIAAAYGLQFHMAAGRLGDFNYYTVLSNAVCFLYFLIVLIVNIRRLSRGLPTEAWRPRLEGAVVFCITVTFLVYHFVLRPEAFRMGNGGSFYSVLNMVQHYLVPLMALLDWLLFCPKGRWHRSDPLSWLLIPFAYFIYILIRAPFAGNIGGTSSPYPYSFIDVEAYGVGIVARNALLAALGMFVLAYLLYFIDRGLARLGQREEGKCPLRFLRRASRSDRR